MAVFSLGKIGTGSRRGDFIGNLLPQKKQKSGE
jgi:hypothetical protein